MSGPIVTVEEGQVQGKIVTDYRGEDFYSFLGIPYGKAPVGELRFRAPQPVEAWSGIHDGTKEGPACPSLHMYFLYPIGKEDNCLNLNVHTRQLPITQNTPLKPVMFWVHGGAFVYGSNSNELYGPEYIITEDVVIVAINYRLGILGFLCLEDKSLKVPGNAGMKDMVLALQWVQRNIHNFGGDPNNVTIFGESAGAASIHYLVLSPLTKGLFHKAIIQSGSALSPWARGRPNALDAAVCCNYNETDEREIFEKLQKESSKIFGKGILKHRDEFVAPCVRPFGPVVEQPSDEPAFLDEDPLDIMSAGKFNKVPVIFGYNTQEGLLFELVRKTRNAQILTNMESEIPYNVNLEPGSHESKEVAEKIKKYYFQDSEISEDTVDCLYSIKTDNQFTYPIYKSIMLQRLSSDEPIYLYRMSLDGPLNFFKQFCCCKYLKTMFVFLLFAKLSKNYPKLKKPFLAMSKMFPSKPMNGVCHADDLGYLFTTFSVPIITPGDESEKHVKRFVKLWTNFAKVGNPTPHPEDDTLNKVTWSPVKLNEISCLEIGENLKQTNLPDEDRMLFWNDIYEEYRK